MTQRSGLCHPEQRLRRVARRYGLFHALEKSRREVLHKRGLPGHRRGGGCYRRRQRSGMYINKDVDICVYGTFFAIVMLQFSYMSFLYGEQLNGHTSVLFYFSGGGGVGSIIFSFTLVL